MIRAGWCRCPGRGGGGRTSRAASGRPAGAGSGRGRRAGSAGARWRVHARPAGQRVHPVGDLGRRRGGVGGGEPDAEPRRRRRPGRRLSTRSQHGPTSSWRNARAARRVGLGPRQLDLRERALGQRLRREQRPLALRHASSSSIARRAMPRLTADTHAASSVKLGNAPSGRVEHGGVRSGCERAVHRHDDAVDGEVQRPDPAQARAVPRVVERHLLGREPAQPERVVVADRAAEDPLAVLRPAAPLPAAGHGHPVAVDDARAGRGERAAGDVRRARRRSPAPRGGSRKNDCVDVRRGDHRAPAGGAVGARPGPRSPSASSADRPRARRRPRPGPSASGRRRRAPRPSPPAGGGPARPRRPGCDQRRHGLGGGDEIGTTFSPAARPSSNRSRQSGTLGLGPAEAVLHVDVVGQAEHPLGDDVALHLAGPAADRQAPARTGSRRTSPGGRACAAGGPARGCCVSVPGREPDRGELGPPRPAGAVAAGQHRAGTDQVASQLHHVLAVLVAEQLADAGLRRPAAPP